MKKNCRSVVLMAACAMGWLGGSNALASSSNEPQQQNIIIPQIAISGGRPDMVSGQSLINLADEIHSRGNETISTFIDPMISPVANDGAHDSPLLWQDMNIASTFPRRSMNLNFSDPALQLPVDDINLVPVPPAIFTGALTLGGMIIVKGLKRFR